MEFPNQAHLPDQSDERLRVRPALETGFAELEDGILLEHIENPKEPGRNLLVFWREGRAEDDEIGHLDQDFVPLQPEDDLSRRIHLAQGVKPHKSLARPKASREAFFISTTLRGEGHEKQEIRQADKRRIDRPYSFP